MGNSNKRIYKVKKDETLWGIAEKKLGDPTKWNEITKDDGSTYTEKEAKNLRAGTKVYIPDITDRELLTFSNLANLDWQFVDIEEIRQSRKSSKKGESIQSTKLHEILSDPKSFIQGYEDPKTKENPIYAYGMDDNNFLGEEVALAEMRRKSGMAMEYLEKKDVGKKEGKFLEDWEV